MSSRAKVRSCQERLDGKALDVVLSLRAGRGTYRLEDGEWKVIVRHADELPQTDAHQR